MQRGKVCSAERQRLDVVQSVSVRSYRVIRVAESVWQIGNAYSTKAESVAQSGRVCNVDWQSLHCKLADSIVQSGRVFRRNGRGYSVFTQNAVQNAEHTCTLQWGLYLSAL